MFCIVSASTELQCDPQTWNCVFYVVTASVELYVPCIVSISKNCNVISAGAELCACDPTGVELCICGCRLTCTKKYLYT